MVKEAFFYTLIIFIAFVITSKVLVIIDHLVLPISYSLPLKYISASIIFILALFISKKLKLL